MSLPWKSELHLRLGHERCELSLQQGWPWRRERLWAGTGQGVGRAAVDDALGQLAATGADLPARAHLVIEDDCVYYALLPAGLRWAEAHERAERHFADALGTSALQVELALAPGGQDWIAAAIASSDFDAWLDALEERQIEAGRIRLALLEDLGRVRRHIPADADVIALVRDQGSTVLQMERGRLSGLSWERIDWHEPALLLQRLAACRSEGSIGSGCLLPASAAQQAALDQPGRQAGWLVLPALAQILAGGAA